MADPAVTERLGNTLVLEGLIIVESQVRRHHGMRAAVAAGTVNSAVAGIIAIKYRPRVKKGSGV